MENKWLEGLRKEEQQARNKKGILEKILEVHKGKDGLRVDERMTVDHEVTQECTSKGGMSTSSHSNIISSSSLKLEKKGQNSPNLGKDFKNQGVGPSERLGRVFQLARD